MSRIRVGSYVTLKEELKTYNKTYEKGHMFKVYGSSYRGWDLIDLDGNKVDECLFIHNKLEFLC